MEQIFDGYSPACQEAVVESRKQKDKILYVFHRVIDGLKYVLTDDSEGKGNLLGSYQNGVIYEKSKEATE